MSTALHGHRGIIDSSLGIGSHSSVLESPEFDAGDRRADGGGEAAAAEECGSSESSSIGKNSDASLDGDDDGEEENEVQSSYRGPLEMMDALEEVLPFRRGISNFYPGKSKSYTSLADAASSDVKEIAKPENAYSRRRRNLLAFHQNWDKCRNPTLKSNAGGISKRPLSSSKSTLALAVAMSSWESYSSTSDESSTSLISLSMSPPPLPPLHPQGKSSQGQGHISSPRWSSSRWRSYSVADLQHCSTPLARVRFEDPVDEKDDARI